MVEPSTSGDKAGILSTHAGKNGSFGRLDVVVHQIRDCAPRSMSTERDMFVRLRIGDFSLATPIIATISDATWECSCWIPFEFKPVLDKLEIDILDKNRLTGDDFVGAITIPLTILDNVEAGAVRSNTVKDWYPLVLREGQQGRVTGSLQLSLALASDVRLQDSGAFGEQLTALVASGAPSEACSSSFSSEGLDCRLYLAVMECRGIPAALQPWQSFVRVDGLRQQFRTRGVGTKGQGAAGSSATGAVGGISWLEEMVFCCNSSEGDWPEGSLTFELFGAEEGDSVNPTKLGTTELDFGILGNGVQDKWLSLPLSRLGQDAGQPTSSSAQLRIVVVLDRNFNVQRKIPCPAGCYSTVSSSFIGIHLQHICSRTPVSCPHNSVGCPFSGPREDLQLHIAHCPYEQLKDNLYATQAEVESLRKETKHLVQALEQVRHKAGLQSSSKVTSSGTQSGELLACAMECPGISGKSCFAAPMMSLNPSLVATTSNKDCRVRTWRTVDMSAADSFPRLRSSCASLATHDEMQGIVFSGGTFPNDIIQMWDCVDEDAQRPVRSLGDVGEQDAVHSMCQIQGRKLASGDENGMLRLWDVERGVCLAMASAHQLAVNAVTTAQGAGGGFDRVVLSGSGDTFIRVWDQGSWQQTYSLDSMVDAVQDLLVHGHLLIAAGLSVIKVWDLRTLGLITHMDGAAPICIHGKQLFSGCYDVPDMIKAWDMDSWKCVGTLLGHRGKINSICSFGTELMTSSQDGSCRVWKAV